MFPDAFERFTNVVALKQVGYVVGDRDCQLYLRLLLAIDDFCRKSVSKLVQVLY
jgi:hypothetical protein